MRDTIRFRAGDVRQFLDRHSRGAPTILLEAFCSFCEARATEAAAGIAYYMLFSFFPLILISVAVGSALLDIERVQHQMLVFGSEILPPAQDLIKENIQQVMDLKRPVGVIAAIGLLWAATGVFTILARNINIAWRCARPGGFLEWHLVGLALTGALLAGLLLLSLASAVLFSVLNQFEVPFADGISIYETFYWKTAVWLTPWALMFLSSFGLYHWIPNTAVDWSEAAWGALAAASSWHISKLVFVWYLESGLTSHRLIYGTLGTVAVLMLWVYLSGLIVLFGAHLSATIGRKRQKQSENR